MARKIGDSMMFTGGAEPAPKVTVGHYPVAGMHYGDPTLIIDQDGNTILLSPGTMQAILDWYNRD